MTTILCINDDMAATRKVASLIAGMGDTDCHIESLDVGITWSRKNPVDLICIPITFAAISHASFQKISRWYREMKGADPSPSFFWYGVFGDGLCLIDASAGIASFGLNQQAPQEFLSLVRQATGRRRMERTLRAEYDHHARIIRSLPFACLQVRGGRIIWTNPAAGTLAGIPAASLPGMEVSEIFTPGSGKTERSSVFPEARIMNGSFRHHSGDQVPCRLFWYPDGVSPDGLWFIEDRHEYTLLEENLRETRQECREQLFLSETVIVRLSADGMITFANQAALRCFGYEEGGIADQPVSLLFPEGGPDISGSMEMFLEIENESSSATIRVMEHLHSDGRKVFIAWTVRAFYSPSGELASILCVGTDMTEEMPDGEGRISTRVWRDRILEGTDIDPEVFDTILQACMEIAREGREGKPIGTSFIVGDLDAVMSRSRQLILNPFYGHPPEMRTVTAPDVREMLKEYALLDGAFIVSGSGMLEAAGRYITVDTSVISLPKGMGTRHSSTAALTAVTSAVGFVVSESGGRVSIIKNGKIVRMIG